MTTTPHPGTDDLTEDQRRAALARFQVLRPHLEEDIPLDRIAHEQNLSLRTLSRWAATYRRLGLAGLCRKSRTDIRDLALMSVFFLTGCRVSAVVGACVGHLETEGSSITSM